MARTQTEIRTMVDEYYRALIDAGLMTESFEMTNKYQARLFRYTQRNCVYEWSWAADNLEFPWLPGNVEDDPYEWYFDFLDPTDPNEFEKIAAGIEKMYEVMGIVREKPGVTALEEIVF